LNLQIFEHNIVNQLIDYEYGRGTYEFGYWSS